MIRSRNSWPHTCPGELKTRSDKHLHTNVPNSFVHTSQVGWRNEPLGGQERPLWSDTAFPNQAGGDGCTTLNVPKPTGLCDSRGWNFTLCNLYINKAGENTDLREKAFPEIKRGYFIMIQEVIHEEDVAVTNVYAPSIMRPNLTELKKQAALQTQQETLIPFSQIDETDKNI